jgi:hypothetical protein
VQNRLWPAAEFWLAIIAAPDRPLSALFRASRCVGKIVASRPGHYQTTANPISLCSDQTNTDLEYTTVATTTTKVELLSFGNARKRRNERAFNLQLHAGLPAPQLRYSQHGRSCFGRYVQLARYSFEDLFSKATMSRQDIATSTTRDRLR